MSFLNLNPTWTDQPLTDPRVAADVVDLMVSLGDRQRGTFAVVLCDPDDRYRATVAVELPPELTWPSQGEPRLAQVDGSRSGGCCTRPGFERASPALDTGALDTGALDTDALGTDDLATGDLATGDLATGDLNTGDLDTGDLDAGVLCANVLRPVVSAVQTAPGTGVVLALGRPGPAHWPDLDDEWAQAGTAICRAAGLRLLGFYIAARDGVYQPLVSQPLVNRPLVAEPAVHRPPVDQPSAA